MLNSLSLIIVMISSLFLAFYCVDSHKNNIVTLVNMDKKSMEPVFVKVEENLTKQELKVVEPAEAIEKVYVEVLAVDDRNDSSKIVEEEIKSKIVVEESIPVEVEKEETVKEVKSIKEVEIIEEVEPNKEVKVVSKKAIDDKVTSEYSEGYKLDDLEKMIREELKKGKKD